MIKQDGEHAEVSGAMTLPTAKALLAEGVAAISGSTRVFDLAGVSEVDSSGLAVLFGWVREAKRQGKALQVINLSKELRSLAEVYGVADLLPLV
jgi:phospholipid transport system transporter-binding protein